MAEDQRLELENAPSFFSHDENEALVAEYEYIAHFMGVPLYDGETHEGYARHLVKTGRQWELRHQTRKLWGKD